MPVRVGATASAELVVGNTTAAQATQLAFSVSQGSSQFQLSCASGCTYSDAICTGSVGVTPAHVVVTFAPTAIGPRAANVTFVTSDPAAPTATATATGVGTGPVFQRVLPADGELALTSLGGHTSDRGIVRIANPGNADLHITSAAFTGDAAAALAIDPGGALPLTVAPGASVDFVVTCAPGCLRGTRTAQLGFTADAGTTTIIDVACTVKPTVIAR